MLLTKTDREKNCCFFLIFFLLLLPCCISCQMPSMRVTTDTWPRRAAQEPLLLLLLRSSLMKSASLQALNPNRAMAAMGRSVRVVLDSSVLLEPSGVTAEEEEVVVALRPGAEALLRRLRYSNLRVVRSGFFTPLDLSPAICD